MIKTKTAFTIFLFLTIIIFPYSIVVSGIDSDFFNAILSDWNTPIVLPKLISNLLKFFILVVVSFYYWKLSKTSDKIDFKKLFIHLIVSIPAILIAKTNLYQLVTIYFYNSESKLSQIQMVVLINIFANILFFTGQILFGIYYLKFQKNTIVIFKQ